MHACMHVCVFVCLCVCVNRYRYVTTEQWPSNVSKTLQCHLRPTPLSLDISVTVLEILSRSEVRVDRRHA